MTEMNRKHLTDVLAQTVSVVKGYKHHIYVMASHGPKSQLTIQHSRFPTIQLLSTRFLPCEQAFAPVF